MDGEKGPGGNHQQHVFTGELPQLPSDRATPSGTITMEARQSR